MFAYSIHLEGTSAGVVVLSIIAIIGAMFVIPSAFLFRRLLRRQKLRASVVTAQYEPPAGLSPAELGYLFDTKFGEAEVVATIIDMVQRGLLKQDPKDKRHISMGDKDADKLTVLEKCMLKLAVSKKHGATIKEMTEGFLSTSWHTGGEAWGVTAGKKFVYTEMVHSELKTKGYVKGNSGIHFVSAVIKMDVALVFLLVFLPLAIWQIVDLLQNGGLDFSEMFNFIGLLVFIPFLLIPFFFPALILTYIRARIVGRTWIRTAKLKKFWPQIEGYREYLRLTEADRLNFETTHLRDKARNRALPYSIALGLSADWASYFFETEKK